jgi:hypothetical protein
MGSLDDRIQMEAHLRELRGLLEGDQGQLSPDAKVTALAAIVQTEALMLMSEALSGAAQTLVHDGLRPLLSYLPGR